MSRSYFQDVAQELGFMQVEWVAGLLSIAHLFGPSKKRCGIYLLYLDGAHFYVGQALDVVRRFAQHLRSKGSIEGFAFLPLPQSRLDADERQLIRQAEAQTIPLVNITHMSVVTGERDLDLLVPLDAQESWLAGKPQAEPTGARVIVDDAQCRRFNSRFQRFSASKHYAQVLEWLAIYLQNAIIAPWRTEYSFWSVSCLPSTGSQAIWRRSYAVNAAVMELFVVGRWSDGADPPWAFINVASDVLEDGFGSLSEVARSHPGLDLSNDHMYRDAGAHQVKLFMEDACCLPRVLADTAIQTAARTLALRVMRKRATIYAKYHCPQLAHAALDAAHK